MNSDRRPNKPTGGLSTTETTVKLQRNQDAIRAIRYVFLAERQNEPKVTVRPPGPAAEPCRSWDVLLRDTTSMSGSGRTNPTGSYSNVPAWMSLLGKRNGISHPPPHRASRVANEPAQRTRSAMGVGEQSDRLLGVEPPLKPVGQAGYPLYRAQSEASPLHQLLPLYRQLTLM